MAGEEVPGVGKGASGSQGRPVALFAEVLAEDCAATGGHRLSRLTANAPLAPREKPTPTMGASGKVDWT
jgi:hypothetical protein